jgi:hypothetical protein
MDKTSISLSLDELLLIRSAVFRTLETLNEDTIKIFWPNANIPWLSTKLNQGIDELYKKKKEGE